MDLEQQLRDYFAPQEPDDDFTASVMARVDSKTAPTDSRTRSRRILMSTVLAVAAAAAMLAWHLLDSNEPAVPAVALPIAATAVVPPESAPEVDTPAPLPAPAPAPTTTATPSVAPVPEQIALTKYTVVAELRQESADPEAKAPVEAFYSALLDELRKVPGLTLLIADSSSPASTADEYRLTVISLATTVFPNGNFSYKWSSGSATTAATTGVRWPVEVMVEHDGKRMQRGIETVVTMGGKDALTRPICLQANPLLPERLRAPCMTAVQLAEWQAESLRQRVFPADPGMRQLLIARLGDRSSTQRQREVALSELITARRDGRGPGVDANVASAIARYAADMPAQRVYIWNRVRGFSHPDLVEPMLDSLRHDTDQRTRLEALASLEADHAGDARVSTALAQLARDEKVDLVRMLAQRSIGGENAWRSYVLANMKDNTRSPEQRVEPLAYVAEFMPASGRQSEMAALDQDGKLTDAVLELARVGRTEPDPLQKGAIRRALNALAMYGRNQDAADGRRQALTAMLQEYSGGLSQIRDMMESSRRELEGEPAKKP